MVSHSRSLAENTANIAGVLQNCLQHEIDTLDILDCSLDFERLQSLMELSPARMLMIQVGQTLNSTEAMRSAHGLHICFLAEVLKPISVAQMQWEDSPIHLAYLLDEKASQVQDSKLQGIHLFTSLRTKI